MEAVSFFYPAKFARQRDGRLLVTFRDLEEALTDGVDQVEARANASDALSEALMGRIADGEEIPLPSHPRRGETLVAPEPTIAAKAALHLVARAHGANPAELARRLHTDHKEARRMLDPRHKSKLPRLAEALEAFGHHVTITVSDVSQAAPSPAGNARKRKPPSPRREKART